VNSRPSTGRITAFLSTVPTILLAFAAFLPQFGFCSDPSGTIPKCTTCDPQETLRQEYELRLQQLKHNFEQKDTVLENKEMLYLYNISLYEPNIAQQDAELHQFLEGPEIEWKVVVSNVAFGIFDIITFGEGAWTVKVTCNTALKTVKRTLYRATGETGELVFDWGKFAYHAAKGSAKSTGVIYKVESSNNPNFPGEQYLGYVPVVGSFYEAGRALRENELNRADVMIRITMNLKEMREAQQMWKDKILSVQVERRNHEIEYNETKKELERERDENLEKTTACIPTLR
jgi:hypothetical protein